MRSGFVAVVGRPNTGKSTLVNALVGQKVSIVSDKSQTTRNVIRGVVHGDDWQIVLTDTPGFHKPRTLLGERLNRLVSDSVVEVEAVVLVVDAAAGVGRGDAFVAQRQIQPSRGLKVCVVNKVDLVPREKLLPQLQAAAALAEFDHIVPVSAKRGTGVGELRDVLVPILPEGPAFYEPEQVTDQPLESRVAEIVREKALALTEEEVPHSVAVQVDAMERDERLARIEARILVERDSQKGILIGKGGEMLKRIGTRARQDLEVLLGQKVFLDLHVKVQKGWQRDPAALNRLGY